MKRPQIIAHRGFSERYPENTMLAFEEAVRAGADGIELDVQFSKDRELVIMHDETLGRTTNGNGLVKDATLSELKELEAPGRFPGQYGVCRIPTLEEYFGLARESGILTNIELKTGVFEYEGIEEAVDRLIHQFGLEERVIISSFNHFSVKRMQRIDPELKYGFLSEDWIINAGAYVASQQVQCYHPAFSSLTWDAVRELKQYGIELNPYTITEEKDVRDLAEKGIDGLIGNDPVMIRRVLDLWEQGRQ